MGFEPTTYSLGSCHSTTELCPQRPGFVSFTPVFRQVRSVLVPRIFLMRGWNRG